MVLRLFQTVVSYGIWERDGVTWSVWLRKDGVSGEAERHERKEISIEMKI